MTRPIQIVYVAHEYPPLSQTFVWREFSHIAKWRPSALFVPMQRPRATGNHAVLDWTEAWHPRMAWSTARFGVKRLPFALPATWRYLTARPFSIRLNLFRTVKALLISLSVASILHEVGSSQDRVHFHAHFFGLMSRVAVLAAAIRGTQSTYSITGHAGDVANPSSASLLQWESSGAKFVSCASRFVESSVARASPDSSRAIVHCGVDAFDHDCRDKPPVSRLQIFTVCRLVPKKGVDTLIDSFALLRSSYPSIHLSIVGDGPDRQDLEGRAARLNLSQAIRFYGAVPPSRVSSLLQEEAGIFVLACRISSSGDTDGIPVALMEAMAACVPVVSTRTGGIPELIAHNETGLIAASTEASSIANAISELLRNPARAGELAQAGLDYVREHFSASTEARKMLELIER